MSNCPKCAGVGFKNSQCPNCKQGPWPKGTSMKLQTIHSNALGDVINETSATGFRITDNQGRVLEVRIDNGIAMMRTPAGDKIVLRVWDEPQALSGWKPTSVIMDDPQQHETAGNAPE